MPACIRRLTSPCAQPALLAKLPPRRAAFLLQALRTGAASRAVLELSSTAEGTEGLVRGLQAALKENPSLLLQLRSLVKSG